MSCIEGLNVAVKEEVVALNAEDVVVALNEEGCFVGKSPLPPVHALPPSLGSKYTSVRET